MKEQQQTPLQQKKICIPLSSTKFKAEESPNTDGLTLRHFLSFKFFFIKVQLTYDVLSISAVQQSDPVIHVYTFFVSYYLPSCSITSDWI